MGWALLGETPEPLALGGGALCLAGVVLAAGESERPLAEYDLRMRRTLLLLAVFTAGLALALGGCGGSGDDKPAGTNGTTTSDGYGY